MLNISTPSFTNSLIIFILIPASSILSSILLTDVILSSEQISSELICFPVFGENIPNFVTSLVFFEPSFLSIITIINSSLVNEISFFTFS